MKKILLSIWKKIGIYILILAIIGFMIVTWVAWMIDLDREPYIEKEHPTVSATPLDPAILDQCKKEGCSAWMNSFMDDTNTMRTMYYILSNTSGKIIHSASIQKMDDGWIIQMARMRFDIINNALVFRFLSYLKEPPIISLPPHRLIETDMHGTITDRIKLEGEISSYVTHISQGWWKLYIGLMRQMKSYIQIYDIPSMQLKKELQLTKNGFISDDKMLLVPEEGKIYLIAADRPGLHETGRNNTYVFAIDTSTYEIKKNEIFSYVNATHKDAGFAGSLGYEKKSRQLMLAGGYFNNMNGEPLGASWMALLDPRTLAKKDVFPIGEISTVGAIACDIGDSDIVYIGDTLEKKLTKITLSSKKAEIFPLEAPAYYNLKSINKTTLLYGWEFLFDTKTKKNTPLSNHDAYTDSWLSSVVEFIPE